MNRKLIISALTAALTLLSASATFAKPLNTFSINFQPSGTSEVSGVDYDFNQISLGLTVPLNNKVEFNGEIASGNIDTPYKDSETNNYKLKCDYRIFEDRTVRLDLSGGLYHRDLELYDYAVNSLIVGIDSRIKLNKQLSVYAGLGIGLMAKEEAFGHNGDPDSLLLFHIKLNYLLNSRFGLALGYTSESIDSELLRDDNYYKGLNGGVFFRF